MTLTETTPLLAAASTTSNGATTATATTSTSTQPPGHQQHRLLCVGGISLLLSCIVLFIVVFLLGYELSSQQLQLQQRGDRDHSDDSSSYSSSTTSKLRQQPAEIPPNTADYTMQVTTPAGKGLPDDTTSSSSSSGFQYVATQFISFTINTMGGLQDHGECDDEHTVDVNNGVCYLGNIHNITHDVEHRLNIVKYILRRIKQDSFEQIPTIDHMDNILKIVSLPEFFWRGPNGAYTIEEMNELFIPFANQLRHMIQDEFYSDFVFCFGTIVAARPISSSTTKDTSRTIDTSTTTTSKKLLHAAEMEYFNFAPISVGGTNCHSYVVMKQYISTADFLSRGSESGGESSTSSSSSSSSTTVPNPTEENIRDYAEFDTELQAFFEQQNNATIVKDNVIIIDGIRIGIEICLDHRLGVLWNNLLSHHHGSKDLQLVDVLLITSAGMAIERGPNPIVLGGVVYLCDGSASSAACIRPPNSDTEFHPNHVCRGDTNINGLKHIPIGASGYSSFVELSACWDMEEEHLLKGYYSLYQPQGCAFTLLTYGIDVMDEFKFYPPSIEIYPTIALPFR